ncbi:MAG: beta galactosidase jelly roll domain-containing protein [Prevotella sp.]|nr:beta galactosidase jelly roll domain-containing protein [Prevotella sp.]
MSALSTSANEVLSLNSKDGTLWKLFPTDGVAQPRVIIGRFEPTAYVEGIVPGTVLNAYVQAGEEEDPDWGDNAYNIDETKYNRSFWYRTTFDRPELSNGKRTILTFEGTNRYATIFFNGKQIGRIKGHVLKVRYDITSLLKDEYNILAVKIETPKASVLPRDASYANYVMPTYVASHSWDWMPYVPGLNCGITNDVYLEFAGDVTLRDPWVRTTSLGANNQIATLGLQTSLVNLSGETREVEVQATVMPGNQKVTKTVTINASDSIDVQLSDLVVRNPLLWWPNGSGEQNLYTCRFDVLIDGSIVDTKTETFGIKKYEYKKENTTMVVYVNGKKVYCKGGNWGMSDYMLKCQGKEYDTRIKLHKDMHYNMIRLWTGCVTDEEFYEACDKYGIMVWDDFWLTGPYTGLTGPDDRKEFMSNAKDKVIRLRNHPSLAIWCGCNEGWPYDELNQEIIDVVKTYDGSDRVYIPNSHNGYPTRQQYEDQDGSGLGLSGSGWWTNFPPEEYFEKGIWGGGGDQGDKVDWGFRSELGMGAFTTWESFKEFMPEEYWWPRNEMWEKHFFSDKAEYGGGAGSTNYFNTVQTGYGTSTSAEQFCEKAQLMNIEVMKALYEGWQDNLWNTASGLLFWMSQAAYPCFIWQTYDYYYDMTGTYWGAKKACEPVHIQWNCHNNKINIVNTSGENADGLTAEIQMFRLNGTPYEPNTTTVSGINVPMNTVTNVYQLATPSFTGMYFIRLYLYDKDHHLVSENFYWKTTRGSKNSYTDLNRLSQASVEYTILSKETDDEGVTRLRIRIENKESEASKVAFALRVRLVHPSSGKRILPVIMDENYFTLFAGESRELTLEYDASLCEPMPKILIKQYNHPEFDQNPDGIREVSAGNQAVKPSATYNLHGQKVSPAGPGIYIINGRKVIK